MPKGMLSYLTLVILTVLFVAVIGIFAPMLVSSKSDAGVLTGFALLLVGGPFLGWMIIHRYRKTKEGKIVSKNIARKVRKIAPLLLLCAMLGACSKVPAGNVGIIVNLYGTEKGVSEKEVGVGKYWIGWNEELYIFPTFTQNDTWRITFQTGRDGLVFNADFSITFRVDPSKVTTLFQTYRKGVGEISDIYLRNLVRDGLNEVAAEMSADEAYGKRKNELVNRMEESVRKVVSSKGIIVEQVYLVGEMRLPQLVKDALDQKNRAFQQTLQKQQEIESAKAEAEKRIEEARGQAESITLVANAQASANEKIAKSITPDLVRYKAIEKWNSELPRLMSGGAIPFIDISSEINKK